MAKPTDSFKQFSHALRPSKQVERKIMIEVLHRLSGATYNISDYAYIGFGSVYYVDFMMFHKYLFIEKMDCIEWSAIPKRMRFNKPFKFIKLKLGPFSKYISSIRTTKPLLVWLDYDRALDPEMLQDIDGCVSRFAPKSIFTVTIDARPKLPKDQHDLENKPAVELERETVRIYNLWFGTYFDKKVTHDLISRVDVAPLFYEVVSERIRQTLTRRGKGLRFIQLFNFLYRDGAPMFTLGGMIGTEEDERAIKKARILDHRFVRPGSKCLEISVPPLTMREKQWLDTRVGPQLTAEKLKFELDEDLLQNYCTFYKEYPTYLETLL